MFHRHVDEGAYPINPSVHPLAIIQIIWKKKCRARLEFMNHVSNSCRLDTCIASEDD